VVFICLRPLVEKDLLQLKKWVYEGDLIEYTYAISSKNAYQNGKLQQKYLDKYYQSLFSNTNQQAFAIEVAGMHIGNIGLKSLIHESSCECFVEIAYKSLRGRGIGKTAMVIAIDYAFVQLNMQRLYLEVIANNTQALALYYGLGFFRVGISNWHYDKNLRPWAVWRMQLYKSHWLKLRPSLNLKHRGKINMPALGQALTV